LDATPSPEKSKNLRFKMSIKKRPPRRPFNIYS